MGNNTNDFAKYKSEFDEIYKKEKSIISPVPMHKTYNKQVPLTKTDGKNEEFYRQELIYALINSGMYSKDYIGAEVFFPKGNKNSSNLKIDLCIFDDKKWFSYYIKWHDENHNDSLDWLREHLIFAIEIKKEESKSIADVYSNQLQPYMNCSTHPKILGAIYDTGRLYLFKKTNNNFIRFDETLNKKGVNSRTSDLSLDIFDAYIKFPSFNQLNYINNKIDRSNRTIDDLDIISGTHNQILKDNISQILKIMDKQSLNNQRGYEILIQMLALKYFDEKRNEESSEIKLEFYETQKEREKLSFYINEEERNFLTLSDIQVQTFIARMQKLYDDASERYNHILKKDSSETISWNKKEHVILIGEIVYQFQDYSFIKSSSNDLYQLVFYEFANKFSQKENAQFVTPIDIIDFLTEIINPKAGETIIDPTVGIADFLAVAFKKANGRLSDKNLYGVDNQESMIMLAQLNMLLNGDGNANLQCKSSLNYKFNNHGDMKELIPYLNKNGNWDKSVDQQKLKKFDIVLTNPPFGKNRSYDSTNENINNLQLYELWNKVASSTNSGNPKIDPGLIFLENAYRILEDNGRLGIVLSSSIAGVNSYEFARRWLIDKMRIVALFDLPEGVFADTNVNTTLLVAYKPTDEALSKLRSENYEVFSKKIRKVGYKVVVKDRVASFDPIYKLDNDYNYEVDRDGNPIKDEEFTETIHEFKEWIKTQEEDLKKLFGD